ncbi:sperm equatorial segment protein 1 [Dipodomys merriami]|uniref:sperm equatorial segment protein 1 n=1 Tax=Dipodomys merriami TaxID=94247 RepID=UPI003855C1EF
MTSVVLLAALLLWPAPLPAHSSLTVSPDEEQNLHHYVQILENLLLSVPTREPDTEDKSTSAKNVRSTGSKAPWQARKSSPGSPPEQNTAISSVSPDKVPFATEGSPPTQKKKKTDTTTAFWSIKPNNISVVLRTNEPFIEKEPEPEPEPQPQPQPQTQPQTQPEPTARQSSTPLTTLLTTRSWTTTHFTTTARRTDLQMSTDLEDVPQLSGEYGLESLGEADHHPQMMSKDDILRKISDIRFLVQHVPPGDSSNPEHREYVRASREYLKRSLALAAAAERRLEKMYRSPIFAGGRAGNGMADMDTVINTLYDSRPRLWEYLDVKYLPPEMRWKATAVVNTLKSILCAGQADSQILIRKLLSNNIKILNLLNVPGRN